MALMRRSTRNALPREPLDGEKGRGTPAEYTAELVPQRSDEGSVGVSRVRPLPRGSVLALHEAADREGAANQRWYRESISPSVPAGTGAFYSVSVNF